MEPSDRKHRATLVALARNRGEIDAQKLTQLLTDAVAARSLVPPRPPARLASRP